MARLQHSMTPQEDLFTEVHEFNLLLMTIM